MKIKDLPGTMGLLGVKIKIPKKYEDDYSDIKGNMYIYSHWSKGVWLKKKMDESRIYPLTFNKDLREILEFTVVKG